MNAIWAQAAADARNITRASLWPSLMIDEPWLLMFTNSPADAAFTKIPLVHSISLPRTLPRTHRLYPTHNEKAAIKAGTVPEVAIMMMMMAATRYGVQRPKIRENTQSMGKRVIVPPSVPTSGRYHEEVSPGYRYNQRGEPQGTDNRIGVAVTEASPSCP